MKTDAESIEIYDTSKVALNTYKGGVLQQSTSAVAVTNQACYEQSGGCASVYGYVHIPSSTIE